ncbi:MAG TPA: hypothetical protein VJ652_10520, partial [Noviherbaspirillum sp.]|nr:hypothetical protein [Noviherbaspirillum sp.]
ARRVRAGRAHRGVASLAQGLTLSGAPRLALHPFWLERAPCTNMKAALTRSGTLQCFRRDRELGLRRTFALGATPAAASASVSTRCRCSFRTPFDPVRRLLQSASFHESDEGDTQHALGRFRQVAPQDHPGSENDNRGDNHFLHHPPPSMARLI